MSAKAIIERYLKRVKLEKATAEELRQHVVAVAYEANLSLTREELDELAGGSPHPASPEGGELFQSGDETVENSGKVDETVGDSGKVKKKKKAVSGDLKGADEKTGDTTSEKI